MIKFSNTYENEDGGGSNKHFHKYWYKVKLIYLFAYCLGRRRRRTNEARICSCIYHEIMSKT